MPKVGLDEIADVAILRTIWKRNIRPRLRATRLGDFILAHDALDCLALDFALTDTLTRLSQELGAGSYRPQQAEVIRAAKTVGLTRPLSFPATVDSIVFRTIISRAQTELMSSSPSWARFGRTDRGDDDESDTPAESGWFRDWLRRQAQLWVITGTNEWLVETDIANFFPYVDIGEVAENVLASSSLSQDVVRLLEVILRSLSPMRGYRSSRIGGLPQEPFDSSRILAHAYLRPLDETFAF